MVRQTIAILTMTAIVNLTFVGCSTVVNMRLDEVAVDTPKRITGVVSKSGEELTFDEKGGKYDPGQRRITGADADGERLIRSLKNLDIVRVVELREDSLSPLTVGARNFHDYIRPGKVDEIMSVETKNGITHKFWNFGRMDQLNRIIIGPSGTSTSLIIPFDSVAYVGVRRPDGPKTLLLVAGCLAVLTALSIYAFEEAWDNAFYDCPPPPSNL